MRSFAAVMLLLTGLLFAAQSASACDRCNGYGFGGYGVYGSGLPYSLYVQETVPYYSVHPPVYYSYPVPRTYGYSPFAYPPGVMTPDVAPAPAMPAPNGAVSPTKLDKMPERVTVKPLMVINPFVEQKPAQPFGDVAVMIFNPFAIEKK